MTQPVESIHYAILKLLEEVPATRDSDDELLKEYSKRHMRIEIDLRKLGGSFPLLKTIERERRKIQSLRKDLVASPFVKDKRMELENDYKIKARNYNYESMHSTF